MQNKWRELPAMQKAVTVISIITSTLVVVLAVLQLFEVWNNAINVGMPLLGVVNLCQAYFQWRTNRITAYFCIGTAVFILICSIVVFFVR